MYSHLPDTEATLILLYKPSNASSRPSYFPHTSTVSTFEVAYKNAQYKSTVIKTILLQLIVNVTAFYAQTTNQSLVCQISTKLGCCLTFRSGARGLEFAGDRPVAVGIPELSSQMLKCIRLRVFGGQVTKSMRFGTFVGFQKGNCVLFAKCSSAVSQQDSWLPLT